jgi:hypothetical protein
VVVGASGSDSTTVGNAVLGNRIYGNGSLGIDLGDNGVTINSTGGPNSGPNDLQNYPVLNSARLSGSDLIVTGMLNSVANTTFRIEVFASDSAYSNGYGQGEQFLGYVTVTTNANGNGSFLAAFSAGSAGDFISATATEVTGINTAANVQFGDTSEFSTTVLAN